MADSVGAAEVDSEVLVDVHSWDYALSVVFAIVLLITLVGMAKYSLHANYLTNLIILTTIGSLTCKQAILIFT